MEQKWPFWMKAVWQLLALFVLAMQVPAKTVTTPDGTRQGGGWLYNLYPPVDEKLTDLYQEWGSARNWRTGLPIYSPHRQTIPQHLGLDIHDKVLFIEYNAHPPTMVLFALPLGYMSYMDALVVWHVLSALGFVLSAWLVLWGLRIVPQRSWAWWILPGLALLAMLDPFREQFAVAQLNGLLLPCLVGAWLAARSQRQGIAGTCIGVAASIKIFPLFLLLFLWQRRQYRAVGTSLAVLVLLQGITLAVLGVDTYRDYGTTVLPALDAFRSNWENQSIVGFWQRLFVGNEQKWVTPLVYDPRLAWFGTILTALLIVGMTLRVTCRVTTEPVWDRCYWLFVTAMVLLGPLTWSHSLLLLAVPIGFLIHDTRLQLPPKKLVHVLLLVIFSLYFVEQRLFMNDLVARGWLAKPLTPWGSLLVSSLPCYALATLFLLQRRAIQRMTTPLCTVDRTSTPREAVLVGR